MRYMTASTLHQAAGKNPKGFRLLFAAMARVADLQMDRFARASFIEGLMKMRPGTLLKNPGQLAEAESALQSGDESKVAENKIADHLLNKRGMSLKGAQALLGDRDRDLYGALMRGVSQVVPREGLRGLSAEGITNALAMGISPLTNDPFPAWKGGNIFHHTGYGAKGRVSLGGLASILAKRGKQQALSILSGAREEELSQRYLDAPSLGDMEGTLQDVISGESAIGRADYVQMAQAIFQNPSLMRALDKAVRSELNGPAQVRVWDAVKNNPHLIKVNPDGSVGVSGTALAKVIGEATGVQVSPSKTNEMWRKKVWPAVEAGFGESAVARTLLRDREILDIIQEETQSRSQIHSPIRNIRKMEDGGSSRMRSAKWAAKRVAQRYAAKKGLVEA